METKELAKLLKGRILCIGTYLKYLETISKILKENKNGFEIEIFVPIYFAIESTVYIEFFKLFDSNKEAGQYNIYSLLDKNNKFDKRFYRELSNCQNTIDNIKLKRNKIYAHELRSNHQDYSSTLISELQKLLQTLVNICSEKNDEISSCIYTANAVSFERIFPEMINATSQIIEWNNFRLSNKISEEIICFIKKKLQEKKPMNEIKYIQTFRGEYEFLSNFYNAPVIYKGLTYQNSEAAFQAQKCTSEEEKKQFTAMNPSEAKRTGRRIKLRPDWEDVKVDEMRNIVRAKFSQNPELAEKLIQTGDAYLEEGNTWGDRTWGTVNGSGQNLLGKILMETRDKLNK